MSGARADQSNVTLDGIDVNDPQNQNAFTSRAAHDARLGAGVPRHAPATTAPTGRSSGPQVSLVTRSGTNALSGSGYCVNRDTAFSSTTTS